MLHDQNSAFAGYHKTELLGGDITFFNAQYRRHAMVKPDLYEALRDCLRDASLPLRAVMEASVELSDMDMPQPDIFLTRDACGAGAFPGESVVLIVEITDSTQRKDLGKKAMIYARGGVPEYWVLDTEACMAHQHWMPSAEASAERREIAFGSAITAQTMAGLVVTLPR